MPQARIAVIGAGLAGAAAASQISHFASVDLFEKSRGYGGRMAYRRRDGFNFTHGAQFFTARSDEFAALVQRAVSEQVAAEWQPKLLTFSADQRPYKREWFEPHYSALGGMSSLARFVLQSESASKLEATVSTRICSLDGDAGRWELRDEQGVTHGPYDWVVSAIPSTQAVDLLPTSVSYYRSLERVEFSPCFALLLGLDEPIELGCDAAVLRDSSLAWLAVESSRPGHSAGFGITAHSRNSWASEHIDSDKDWVKATLMNELRRLFPAVTGEAVYCDLHRWLYARCEQALEQDYLMDEKARIASVGEWCLGNRVEDAFLSGNRLGQALGKLI